MAADGSNLEARLLAFERAWSGHAAPDILDFLNGQTGQARRALLFELISTDLEYRWRTHVPQAASAEPWALEAYAVRFGELGSTGGLPIELIAEEYRARQLWGDHPSHDAYFARFSIEREQLAHALAAVDIELRREADDTARQIGGNAAISGERHDRFDPRAPLSYRDFRLKQLIGAGGVGKVYRAWQCSLERDVAVKYLRRSLARSPDVIERFIAEAKIVAQLHHPGIVSIYGVGKTRVSYFFSMELVEGCDLSRLAGRRPISPSDAVGWVVQASEAIEHAHERGIVHCDLKPANLLIDGTGRVRVTDFGFARSSADTTIDNQCMEGTAAFMAPEQISEFWGPIAPYTDVYGLGAVLYTLLVGRPPWIAGSAAGILAQVLSAAEARPLTDYRSDIPSIVAATVAKCLKKVPGERFQTAAELRNVLLQTSR